MIRKSKAVNEILGKFGVYGYLIPSTIPKGYGSIYPTDSLLSIQSKVV